MTSTSTDLDTPSKDPPSKNVQTSPPHDDETPNNATNPKKRRKVNHACVYCRRSHMTCDSKRPCERCIKRNIGHLCHDEPREPVRRAKSEQEQSAGDEDISPKREFGAPVPAMAPRPLDQIGGDEQALPHGLPTSSVALDESASFRQGQSAAVPPTQGLDGANQPVMGYNDWNMGSLQDMHNFHPSYMFNAPEVNNEYNLLGDFLSNSMLDDGGMYSGDDFPGMYTDPLMSSLPGTLGGNNGQALPHPAQSSPQQQNVSKESTEPSKSSSAVPLEKARETYYMTAADPSGTDPPEERMNKLLKAKYDAGMLKPFNYVKGYARLNTYMEQHMQPISRQKILRQLDKFRPKFRERMQSLTDIELVLVEMWFERSLMEYDRVFASMAIPACCWRRTGEIFRGNKEMAELIHVPIEKLRDGKLAIHEIIVEDLLVSYWEKFGAIAFDNTQKAMLTSCTLKNPDLSAPDKGISCCFSFTIRRDNHNIPSLIVGNFLPIRPLQR